MAITKNLVIDQGSTFTANLQYVTNSKIPVDLTGYTVRSQLRKSYKSANSAAIAATVINAAYGNISLSLSAIQTSNLPHGRYVYDVEALQGNTIIRIVEGIITVYPGVSGIATGSILINGKTTSDISEGTNLYFTNARVYANVIGLLPNNTTNIKAEYFTGNGSLLTGIIGSNVVGTVPASNIVTYPIQTNITSVGTLTSLTVAGTLTGNNIVASGNITASNFVGSGAGTPAISSVTNLDLIPTIAVRILGSGTLTANGDVTGANLLTRNYLINSIQTNISAAGTTQNTATLLGNTINIVNTGISGAGVILPNVNPGIVIFIKNATGNDLSIYPQLNAQIDSASTNAAYVLASSNTTLRLISASYTQWYT